MNLLLLLQMAADGRPDQVAVAVDGDALTTTELLAGAWAGAELVGDAATLVYVGTNSLAFPVGLFAAAAAGVPFVPLNYRLSDEQVDRLIEPLDAPVVVADAATSEALAARGHRVLDAAAFVAGARSGHAVGEVPADADGAAVLLYTSGTTAAPKAAVLRHRNLTSYVITTVEYGGAEPDEAVLVSVPPYHVAGLANLLSNLYLGRRIVYLRQFDAAAWVATVRDEKITHAMVVPTMLARICDVLEADGDGLPSLRALSYGGARTPATLLQRVMALLPEVDLTNAYGLTETSSTIAILGPDDHRAARQGDATAIERLSSAGKVLPTVELEIRDGELVLDPGVVGEIWVRGEQVSGEYAGREAPLDAHGWFPTRDRGWID
ncbi:MAG TPA: class I adenylate-forming enzyme family protein, partial [Acidimicrobiales bacterium]|nr:class I adenylate-forming enzyme family protein [Acidimicrobiales bacterium]